MKSWSISWPERAELRGDPDRRNRHAHQNKTHRAASRCRGSRILGASTQALRISARSFFGNSPAKPIERLREAGTSAVGRAHLNSTRRQSGVVPIDCAQKSTTEGFESLPLPRRNSKILQGRKRWLGVLAEYRTAGSLRRGVTSLIRLRPRFAASGTERPLRRSDEPSASSRPTTPCDRQGSARPRSS